MVSSGVHIVIVPVLEDNYSYLICWGTSALVVDPGEAGPIMEALAQYNLQLEGILLTHHHNDHVGGSVALQKMAGCPVWGPKDSFISSVTDPLPVGSYTIKNIQIQVLAVPGHTMDHIAYYLPKERALFSGDALFGAGTGRLFEGTVEQMLRSLDHIQSLPQDTKVYCGHEYTVKNLEFARLVEPGNVRVEERLTLARQLREQGKPTMPSTLSLELRTNPFLRLYAEGIRQILELVEATDAEVFAELRRRRNQF